MALWHGFHHHVPLNPGGGVDLRGQQQPIGVFSVLTGDQRARQQYQACVDHAHHFRQRERRIRSWIKLRDNTGHLVVRNDGSEHYCHICSETVSVFKQNPRIARHRHEDSADWRASIFNDSHLYPCFTCYRSPHTYDIAGMNIPWTGGRIPVMATASTLYQWQGSRHRTGYPGDPFHIERVSVAGARVKDLGHAVAAAYFGLGIPVDLLVICGLNDINQGKSAHQIMCDFAMLQEAVETNLPTSTVTLATLPLPPKLCRFPGDRSWRPRSFQNKLSVLIELNTSIMAFNEVNSRRLQRPTDLAPTYHTRGIKTRINLGARQIGPRNILETVLSHKYSCWRERVPHRMMHLNEMTVLSMGKAAVHFFKGFYGMIPRIPRARGGRNVGGGGAQGERAPNDQDEDMQDGNLAVNVIDDETHHNEDDDNSDSSNRGSAQVNHEQVITMDGAENLLTGAVQIMQI